MIINNKDAQTYFPRQQVSSRKKTKDWFIRCAESLESIIFNESLNDIRQSHWNKRVNYDLYNGIINENDIEAVFNPMKFSGSIPAAINNYSVANSKIDLLVGEEKKRKFDYKVISVNDDAVSELESEKLQSLMEIAIQSLSEGKSQEEIQLAIKKLDKYFKYEYQDLHADTAAKILKYLDKQQELPYKFNRGFLDGLIAGEEIYRIDIVAGNPILERVNPLHVFVMSSGDSPFIEDSEAIVELTYESIGSIIDEFSEYLTEKEIKQLEDREGKKSSGGSDREPSKNPVFTLDDYGYDLEISPYSVDTAYGDYYDDSGNVRVLRIRWKGMRKVYKLTYFDEDGNQQETIKSEYYKPNLEEGESVKSLWISEWHEVTKISEDIYVKYQIRETQFRNRNNLSKCHPGYVGVYYNTNSSKSQSLMDIMKPYQYLYNIFMRRVEYAFARFKAPIMEMDLSKKPDNWEVENWLYYAETLGYLFVDPFNEGKAGAAKGQLSGHFNTTGKVMQADMGNYIQQLILMMQFLETKIGEIAGITKQREGQIRQSETVGGIERSVTQSSHSTEKWFIIHEQVKLRALTTLLEAAKYAYKDNKNKIVHYILDDLGREYINFDGSVLNSSEFGIFISNSQSDLELEQNLKQLSHALIQNDKIDLITLLDIYTSDSMSAIRRKIEQGISVREEEMKQMQQQQMQAEQQLQQTEQKFKVFEIENNNQIEREKMQNDLELKLLDIESKNIQMKENPNNNNSSLEELKIKIQQNKIKLDNSLKEKQLQETIRHNKETEKISKNKNTIKKTQ